MKKIYPQNLHYFTAFIITCFFGILSTAVNAQAFSQSNLDFNGFSSTSLATSLTFGPDGRLYVSEYTGRLKVYTIERVSSSNYRVIASETLIDVRTIQDHDDDGALFGTTAAHNRETTGLAVAGTAANPVIYVASSDFRIGGGTAGGDGDLGLDTNSGIITRFTWNGSNWDVVDLVRGLPRSEENHATNGLEFVTVNGTDYLLVAQGGHTNGGAPSTNFAWTGEYALSAAVLSINLTQLAALPILDDNGRSYIYDLPTLDDPTRANANGIEDPDMPGYDGVDMNDPFGGNDGLNQAMVVAGGPVQIFSPGYRNTYDLVVTESGGVYVTDNGANGGWGGFPSNEGGGSATNNYDPLEPGSSSPSGGEQINNEDHLQLVTTDIQNYAFGSYYGGHPNPTRANPSGAGIWYNPSPSSTAGAVFRTQVYDPDGSTPGSTTDPALGLPANWPAVPLANANPVEGDWRGPGTSNPDGPVDGEVTIWGTNTNGIDEYTASNFGGAMQGDLIAGVNTGVLRRVELNPDGSLETLTSSFASGLGGNALGITCNSDTDPFPGSIWVGKLSGTNAITILEPQDFIECLEPGDPGYDPNGDNDSDGYTNQDEEDNGTDPCNGASQPNDFDKIVAGLLVSDLNDEDDDNDGVLDANDPMQLGNPTNGGSDAFNIPFENDLLSDTAFGGYLGLGLTGLMNNGDANPNWLNWLDDRDAGPNPNDILGGAIGAMTMQMTSGTALGSANDQEKGFQYGINVDQTMAPFTVEAGMANFNSPLQLYGSSAPANGELGIFIGDGTQSNYIKFIITPAGLQALQETGDIAQTPLDVPITVGNRPGSSVIFYMEVNPATGEVALSYSFDNGARTNIGSIVAEGSILQAIQQANTPLMVGMTGTSNSPTEEVEGTWEFLNVSGAAPIITADIPDYNRIVSAPSETLDLDNFFDDDNGVANLTYTVDGNTDPSIGASISDNILTLTFPAVAATSDITITATDADMQSVMQTFTVVVVDDAVVLYRVNAAGPTIAAIDGGMDWEVDTQNNNSIYLVEAAANRAGSFPISTFDSSVDLSTTPTSIFDTERFDTAAGAPNMHYSFPATQSGNYEVRLYMANGFSGTSQPGQRVFDVDIEGTVFPELDNIDLSDRFGHQVGGVINYIILVTDGALDITFLHDVIENPLVNGIEILKVSDAEIPINVNSIADQESFEGEQLDGSLGVSASGGDGNLVYSAVGLPSGVTIEPTNGQIGGTINIGAAAASPYTVTVTVDDSDGDSSDAVDVQFTWVVNERTIYRINAGGILVNATDDGTDWDNNSVEGAFVGDNHTVNTGLIFNSNLQYGNRDVSIPAYIDAATFAALFANERFDEAAGDEMVFTVPVANGDYVVNIFMGNSFSGTSMVGERVFDLDIEGNTVDTNIDLADRFGHQSGGMLSYPVNVTDGEMTITFLHGLIENPLVDAIEIYAEDIAAPLVIDPISSQANGVGETIDFTVVASGGDAMEDFTYYASGLPANLAIDSNTGQITGTIATSAATGGAAGDGVHEVVITVKKLGSAPVTTVINWIVTDDPVLLYRVNAGGPTVAAIDGGLDWEIDTQVNNSTYLAEPAGNRAGSFPITNFDPSIDLATTPTEIFDTERFDDTAGVPNMMYSFPATQSGNYEVRLYMANGFSGTSEAGERVFDVDIEGIIFPELDDIDLSGTYGHQTGVVISFVLPVTDGSLDITFLHGLADNPLVNGIEIFKVSDAELPIEVEDLADQENFEGDQLDGGLIVNAIGGDGNLSYSAVGLPPSVIIDPTNGQIGGSIDAGAAAGSPYNVTITVDDSDGGTADAVQIQFTWIIKARTIYRINAGGIFVNATDDGTNWDNNSLEGAFVGDNHSVNTGLIFNSNLTYPNRDISIPAYIDAATFNSLFANERFDDPADDEMTFTVPLTNGDYVVNIFMGNSFSGTSMPGQRVFDLEIESTVVDTDIDLAARFGNLSGGMLSYPVNVSDGEMNITFLHGLIENPLVDAIEIYQEDTAAPLMITPIGDQVSAVDEVVNLPVIATGGSGTESFTYYIAGQPLGLDIDVNTGEITGTILAAAATGGPAGDGVHEVVISAKKLGSAPVTIVLTWTITQEAWVDKDEDETYTPRHENSFVQAGDKFYLMGGRESAQTVDIYDYTSDSWESLVNSAPFEFNHFQAVEYQGLIWVIGAFKTNTFPSETVAEFVWAFDPADQIWIQGPAIPAARRRGSGGLVVYNNKFYLVGGNDQGHSGGFVPWFDEYDPATGTWTTLTDAPRARDHFHATLIGDKLYAAGGRLSGGAGGVFAPTIAEVDVYDFTTSTWSTLPVDQNIPTPRGGAAAINFNDKLVVVGGEVQNQDVYGVITDDALKVTEEYDPATQSWSRLPDLNSERHGTQAIVSGPGLFIIAGSPNRGGGNQKNLEYLGEDAPIGDPSVASTVSAPTDVQIEEGMTADINLDVSGGNVGVIIKSMVISGPNAADFTISAGELTDALLNPNSNHIITVQDSGMGVSRTAILTITLGDGSTLVINLLSNRAPIAVAAGTPTNGDAPLAVIFNSDGSSDDIGIVSYFWDFKDGTTSLDANPSRTFINPGVYDVELTVTDAGGLTGTAVVTITVSAPSGNEAPVAVATASPLSGPAPLVVNFTGSGSTDDTGIESYLWDFMDGTTSTEADPTHTFINPGNYDVLLTVEDAEGLTGTATITITVTTPDGNEAPVAIAVANPVSGVAPLEVFFDGSGSTDDIGIVSYAWDFMDGTTSNEINPVHTFMNLGIYEVSLTVTDGEGLSNTTTVTITVNNPNGNEPPVAIINATPLTGSAPLEVAFAGGNSTDDIAIVAYLWDFGDGVTSIDDNPVHTFLSPGVYIVRLTVQDNEGLLNSAEVTITVDENIVTESGILDGIVFPNPAREVAKVLVLNLPDDKIVTALRLHDSSGRNVTSYDPQTVLNGSTYDLPITTVRNGIYFVTVEFNSGVPIIIKLVVDN